MGDTTWNKFGHESVLQGHSCLIYSDFDNVFLDLHK